MRYFLFLSCFCCYSDADCVAYTQGRMSGSSLQLKQDFKNDGDEMLAWFSPTNVFD